MTIDEFSKHLIEKAVAELDEAKNKEGKEQGADGKACWKGYKYAGTENGKDKCVKSEEWEKSEKEEKGEKKHKEGKAEEKKEKMKEARDMPGNQEKIDANKNGKVDAHDFALLRAKKAKKSVKEMWEKAAEIAEGKKVEIEVMPDVDIPNDPEKETGKKAKKEVKKEYFELEDGKMKKKHNCAKKVKKEGVEYSVVSGEHTMLDDGTVTHYDIVNEAEGIILHNVPVEELEIMISEVHEHAMNYEKNLEVLDEKKLSKAEAAKKEKFVKGMKKKFGSFKSKYGDRAKEVMYGTATTMAKKSA